METFELTQGQKAAEKKLTRWINADFVPVDAGDDEDDPLMFFVLKGYAELVSPS